MARTLSRRNFIALGSAGIVGVLVSKKLTVQRRSFRILPLPDVDYSPGFLKLVKTKTFRSVDHALRAVCDPELEFAIEEVRPPGIEQIHRSLL